MSPQSFSLNDAKEVISAAELVDHLIHTEHRGRGVHARFMGRDPATGWGRDVEGKIVGVGELFDDRDFAVTFLVKTPERFVTVGGRDAQREDVAAERMELL